MPAGRGAAPVTRPRPGHADLAGGAKYERDDLRDILERASARETAARVAAGALARQLLAHAGIRLTSHVFTIGSHTHRRSRLGRFRARQRARRRRAAALRRCRPRAQMIAEIDRAREAGDTIGGAFEVIATGRAGRARQLRPVGSQARWPPRAGPDVDPRDQGGRASASARKPPRGQDPASTTKSSSETAPRATGLGRPTNNAGGLEGGVTNGEDLRVSAYMKPISTLMKPLRSVDLATMTESPAAIERSDVCAVPAAAVVGEAMVALVLADALLERFGGDSVAALERAMTSADSTLRARFSKG